MKKLIIFTLLCLFINVKPAYSLSQSVEFVGDSINRFTPSYNRTFPFWQKGSGFNTFIQVIAHTDNTRIKITFKGDKTLYTYLVMLNKGNHVWIDTSVCCDRSICEGWKGVLKDNTGYGSITADRNISAIVMVYSGVSTCIIPLQ